MRDLSSSSGFRDCRYWGVRLRLLRVLHFLDSPRTSPICKLPNPLGGRPGIEMEHKQLTLQAFTAPGKQSLFHCGFTVSASQVNFFPDPGSLSLSAARPGRLQTPRRAPQSGWRVQPFCSFLSRSCISLYKYSGRAPVRPVDMAQMQQFSAKKRRKNRSSRRWRCHSASSLSTSACGVGSKSFGFRV